MCITGKIKNSIFTSKQCLLMKNIPQHILVPNVCHLSLFPLQLNFTMQYEIKVKNTTFKKSVFLVSMKNTHTQIMYTSQIYTFTHWSTKRQCHGITSVFEVMSYVADTY
jgi:hypothetical protein